MWTKAAVSIVGLSLYTFSGTYTANPKATAIAYIAAISGAVGGYLIGLFQDRQQPVLAAKPPTDK